MTTRKALLKSQKQILLSLYRKSSVLRAKLTRSGKHLVGVGQYSWTKKINGLSKSASDETLTDLKERGLILYRDLHTVRLVELTKAGSLYVRDFITKDDRVTVSDNSD